MIGELPVVDPVGAVQVILIKVSLYAVITGSDI